MNLFYTVFRMEVILLLFLVLRLLFVSFFAGFSLHLFKFSFGIFDAFASNFEIDIFKPYLQGHGKNLKIVQGAITILKSMGDVCVTPLTFGS